MKAGTTTLAQHLAAHPQVYMTARPKEPSYFLTRAQLLDVYPTIEKFGFWRGEELYLKLFEPAGDRQIVGEASANYARLHRVTGVAERVAEFNPRARIVFIARDPVLRTIAHYWYMVRYSAERRDILTAVRDDRDLCDTSYYAMQLRPWFAYFGADNVYVLTTEALRDQPAETMAKLYRWLEIDDSYLPANIGRRANEAPEVIAQVRGLGVLHRFRNSGLWNAVGPFIPKKIRSFGRSMSEVSVERKHVDDGPVRRFLRPRQRDETKELESLVGRSFPEWSTLHGDH